MSDPFLASVTFELALGQTTVQVELEMTVCLSFVTIEVEELSGCVSIVFVVFVGNLT